MLLSEARCGEKIKIKEFLEEESILKKIEGMGIRKGMVFEVIQRCGRVFLLRNGENRIAVSTDIAKKIEVELVSKGEPPCKEQPCGNKKHRHRWRWCLFGKEE